MKVVVYIGTLICQVLALLISNPAHAGSSFSLIARQIDYTNGRGDGPRNWERSSGVKLYSEDDREFYLIVDNCEFILEEEARSAQEREIIDDVRWFIPKDDASVTLVAVARPVGRKSVTSGRYNDHCSRDRVSAVVIASGKAVSSGGRYNNSPYSGTLGIYFRQKTFDGSLKESQFFLFKTDWFTPKQWSVENAGGILLALISIVGSKIPL